MMFISHSASLCAHYIYMCSSLTIFNKLPYNSFGSSTCFLFVFVFFALPTKGRKYLCASKPYLLLLCLFLSLSASIFFRGENIDISKKLFEMRQLRNMGKFKYLQRARLSNYFPHQFSFVSLHRP